MCVYQRCDGWCCCGNCCIWTKRDASTAITSALRVRERRNCCSNARTETGRRLWMDDAPHMVMLSRKSHCERTEARHITSARIADGDRSELNLKLPVLFTDEAPRTTRHRDCWPWPQTAKLLTTTERPVRCCCVATWLFSSSFICASEHFCQWPVCIRVSVGGS